MTTRTDIYILEIDWSTRVENCLRHSKYKTLEDLNNASDEELLGMKHFGRTSLHEVRTVLADYGYRPGSMPTPAPEPEPESAPGPEPLATKHASEDVVLWALDHIPLVREFIAGNAEITPLPKNPLTKAEKKAVLAAIGVILTGRVLNPFPNAQILADLRSAQAKLLYKKTRTDFLVASASPVSATAAQLDEDLDRLLSNGNS